jgi:glutamate N-acetyltransferase/amino-acid N-acetyltransferase
MTTDSFSKISSFDGSGGKPTLPHCGAGQGAGMIMPNMATMLCFILTDIQIAPDNTAEALSVSAEKDL